MKKAKTTNKRKKLPKYALGDQTAALQTNPSRMGIAGMGAGLASGAVDQFVDVDPITGKNAVGKGIATGALKGAAAGAMFGPIGMGVGAAIGGVTGGFQGKAEKEAIQQAESDRIAAEEAEKQRQQALIYQEQAGKYTFAKGGKMCYPQGGVMGEANAEIEKQEQVRYPNGETEGFNGPSHEQGGIPVNLPAETQVFSDKLKSSTGKTFAKEAKKYSTDKFSKILEDRKADKLAKESAKMMFMQNNMKLNEIFNEQESQKAEKFNKGVAKLQMKYGGTIMKNGGNMLPKYELGKYGPNYGIEQGNSSEESSFGSNIDYGNLAFQGLNFLGQNMGNLKYLKDEGKRYDKVDYGTVRPETYNPELLNANPAIQNARIAANNTQRAIRNNTGGTGSYLSNLGASQANAIASTGNIVDQYANMNTGLKNQANQYNTGARNQFSQFNQQNKIMGMRDEAANKGQALTNYYQTLTNVGSSAGETAIGLKRDQNIQNSENTKMNLLKDLYANYTWNPSTQQWMPKTK